VRDLISGAVWRRSPSMSARIIRGHALLQMRILTHSVSGRTAGLAATVASQLGGQERPTGGGWPTGWARRGS